MSNETKPLVQNEQLTDQVRVGFSRMFGTSYTDIKALTATQVRDLYEADRSKLMAVLQACADALNKSQYVILRMADGPNREAWGPQLDTNDDALSQLKAIGVEPNK